MNDFFVGEIAPVATGIEAEVCADIVRRQQLGVRKYGQTLLDNHAELIERMQHLYEELLDAAVYAKWSLRELRQARARERQRQLEVERFQSEHGEP